MPKNKHCTPSARHCCNKHRQTTQDELQKYQKWNATIHPPYTNQLQPNLSPTNNVSYLTYQFHPGIKINDNRFMQKAMHEAQSAQFMQAAQLEKFMQAA